MKSPNTKSVDAASAAILLICDAYKFTPEEFAKLCWSCAMAHAVSANKDKEVASSLALNSEVYLEQFNLNKN